MLKRYESIGVIALVVLYGCAFGITVNLIIPYKEPLDESMFISFENRSVIPFPIDYNYTNENFLLKRYLYISTGDIQGIVGERNNLLLV